ncbi:unnamed protein product, partial [Iphiclides podalirius]
MNRYLEPDRRPAGARFRGASFPEGLLAMRRRDASIVMEARAAHTDRRPTTSARAAAASPSRDLYAARGAVPTAHLTGRLAIPSPPLAVPARLMRQIPAATLIAMFMPQSTGLPPVQGALSPVRRGWAVPTAAVKDEAAVAT